MYIEKTMIFIVIPKVTNNLKQVNGENSEMVNFLFILLRLNKA